MNSQKGWNFLRLPCKAAYVASLSAIPAAYVASLSAMPDFLLCRFHGMSLGYQP